VPEPSSNLLTDAARTLSDPALDGRAPGTDGHRRAAEYIERALAELDLEPLFPDGYAQPVRGANGVIGRNLGGARSGSGSGETLLVGAHYDHLPGCPGADDNAAAVAIALAAAQRLRTWDGHARLAFCFFDLEEPPHFHTRTMGSLYFTDHPPFDLNGLRCAIILDLCGHDVPIPGSENALFALGAEHHRFLVDAVRAADADDLPLLLARNERVGDMSDHHAFRLKGLPFLFLSGGWWPHHHSPADTFDKLNLDKMHRTVAALVRLIKELGTMRPGPGDNEPPDDFDRHEARSVSRLLGTDVPPDRAAVDAAAAQVLRRLA
jgi:hypothetical protein